MALNGSIVCLEDRVADRSYWGCVLWGGHVGANSVLMLVVVVLTLLMLLLVCLFLRLLLVLVLVLWVVVVVLVLLLVTLLLLVLGLVWVLVGPSRVPCELSGSRILAPEFPLAVHFLRWHEYHVMAERWAVIRVGFIN